MEARQASRQRAYEQAAQVLPLGLRRAALSLPPEELSRAEAVREELAAALAGCGYSEVELALYRTGSMNRPL